MSPELKFVPLDSCMQWKCESAAQWRCTDLHGIPYVGEVMYQFLFEEEGSCHALVVGRGALLAKAMTVGVGCLG